jgi:hypothetical protein
MLESVGMREIEKIFAVTDAMGVHREMLVIPLGPATPGRVRKLPSGKIEIIVDASVPIADLSRYLGTELPDEGDYHTLGGFVVARFGRVPEVGATLSAHGLDFVVREGDERRVTKVEIHRQGPPQSIVPRGPTSRVSAA